MKALEADLHLVDFQLCSSQAVGPEENLSSLLRLSLLVCEMGGNTTSHEEQVIYQGAAKVGKCPPLMVLCTHSASILSPLLRGCIDSPLGLIYSLPREPTQIKTGGPRPWPPKAQANGEASLLPPKTHSFIFSSPKNPLIWMQGLACSLTAYEEDAKRFMVESHVGLSKKKASRTARKRLCLGTKRPKEEVITDLAMLTET